MTSVLTSSDLESLKQIAAFSRPATADEPAKVTTGQRFLNKVRKNMATLQDGLTPVVIVCNGAYNPVHLQHTRIFYVARQFLHDRLGVQVVGGLMSPSHDNVVRQKVKTAPQQLIPARHRVAMCELAVSGSSWLAVGRWECTRKVVMDFPSVIRNVQQALDRSFPARTPVVYYLCGADQMVRSVGRLSCPTVCVTRPGYSDGLSRAVSKKHRAFVHIVDDKSMLSPELDAVSSTKVRAVMAAGRDPIDVVGPLTADYIERHGISAKIAGKEEWSDEDKQAPTLVS